MGHCRFFDYASKSKKEGLFLAYRVDPDKPSDVATTLSELGGA
jgi:hypothetical protein